MNPSSTVENPSPVPARGRWRKRLIVVLSLPLLFLLLVAAIPGYLSLANSWRWQQAFAEADRLDPGWRWEDLKAQQPELADEENAMAQLLLFQTVSPGEIVSQSVYESLGEIAANVQMPAETVGLANNDLVRQAAALDVVRTMADLPRSRSETVLDKDFFSEVLLPIQVARGASELLKWDAYLRCQERDLDRALTSCRGILHVGRATTSDPLLISCLVRISCQSIGVRAIERVLAQGDPSDQSLHALQRALEAEDEDPVLLNVLRGERAYTALPPNITGVNDAVLPFPSSSGFAFLADVARYYWARWRSPSTESERFDNFEFLTQAVEEVKQQPVQEQARRFHESMTKREKELAANPSGFIRISAAFMRHQSILRCALVMVAAERYRQAKGQWPASLEAMTPDYIKGLPKDPYDGATIRLKRVADGLIVYSVGSDGVDDGGKLAWPPQRTGTDIGLKLWDIAQRRQPAKK